MPAITVCMIVCNEEENIGRCLESVCNISDEIIVVDTGSTDQTKLICEKYGAHLYDFPWEKDFSGARNFSLKQATGEWILCLDADEELALFDSSGLHHYLEETPEDILFLPMIHFYGTAPINEKRVYLSTSPRLFRNGKGVHYIGKIHEHINLKDEALSVKNDSIKFMRIMHYGYMEIRDSSKSTRNLDIILEEKDLEPENPWYDYHLAAEYYRKNLYEKAINSVNLAIVGFLRNELVPPSLLYKLKYDILIMTGNFSTVRRSIDKAIELYPDYVDLHFYKGVSQLSYEEYDTAEKTFSYCVVLGESNPNYLILAGTGSFLAMHYLGICYEKQGKSELAAESYKQAILMNPEFEFANQRLSELSE